MGRVVGVRRVVGMRRAVVTGLVLVAAPGAAGEPVPRARLGLEVGPAFIHYSERNDDRDIDGSSTTTGFVVGVDGALGLAENLEATLGVALRESLEADMEYRIQGRTFQKNRFRVEWLEGGPGLAWRVWPGDRAALRLSAGYRLTWERLHILDVPNVGDATEQLLIHGFPLGASMDWRGGTWRLAFSLRAGPTYARMTNNRLEGVVFHSLGFLLDAGPRLGWRAGPGWVTFDLLFDMRRHAGSGFMDATFEGEQVTAIWPSNTTLSALGSIGYQADWP